MAGHLNTFGFATQIATCLLKLIYLSNVLDRLLVRLSTPINSNQIKPTQQVGNVPPSINWDFSSRKDVRDDSNW